MANVKCVVCGYLFTLDMIVRSRENKKNYCKKCYKQIQDAKMSYKQRIALFRKELLNYILEEAKYRAISDYRLPHLMDSLKIDVVLMILYKQSETPLVYQKIMKEIEELLLGEN